VRVAKATATDGLNGVPLIGLAFGLVFFVVGCVRASEQALRAGLRIFVAMALAVLPVVGSGLAAEGVLADAMVNILPGSALGRAFVVDAIAERLANADRRNDMVPQDDGGAAR
jgi:hypothetical protein